MAPFVIPHVSERNHKVMSRWPWRPGWWVPAELQTYNIFIGSCSNPSFAINYSAGAVCLGRQNNFHSSAVSVRLMKATSSLEWNPKLSLCCQYLRKWNTFFSSLGISASINKIRLGFYKCHGLHFWLFIYASKIYIIWLYIICDLYMIHKKKWQMYQQPVKAMHKSTLQKPPSYQCSFEGSNYWPGFLPSCLLWP